jgi:DNA-directed RNA polymerase sigma subunit (sigma70/sigma32)
MNDRTLSKGKAMSLDQISKELGITRERVRQIERDAIKKLLTKLKNRGITEPGHILPEQFEEMKA